ncbi:AAA family ATPase [Agromyces arachidis]|uniref:AAA family ATPase n=1 Tax=Agromyces arachidis TaxID=766966 RepID=UPI0040575D7F
MSGTTDPLASIDQAIMSRQSEEAERVRRARLRRLRTTPVFDPSGSDVATRPYVPGLWSHGSIPALIGPKGWGKTKLLCELTAALVLPGRRLLDHFEAADLTDAERRRDVWLINSETRPGAVHEELQAAGLAFGHRDGVPCYFSPELGPDAGVLIVEHLTMSGGATAFNITEEEKRRYWEERFIGYADQLKPPLTVIADGVTATLGNDTGRTGAFASGFRRLLREAGIPNGLAVLHSPMSPSVNTPMGGIESMGEWDGMWIASAATFPVRPATTRWFETLPRIGDPEVLRRRIELREGRLRLIDVASSPDAGSQTNATDHGGRRAELRAKLLAAEEWLWTKEVCGTGEEYKANKIVLELMEREGEVESRSQGGRNRGYQWRISGANSVTNPDRE